MLNVFLLLWCLYAATMCMLDVQQRRGESVGRVWFNAIAFVFNLAAAAWLIVRLAERVVVPA